MIALIIHITALGYGSLLAARYLVRGWTDRILATAILSWANITCTCLFLSGVTRLGEPAWFFRSSLLLSLGTALLAKRWADSAQAVEPVDDAPINRPLAAFFVLTIGPIFVANVLVAGAYVPSNWDSLTYHLPRSMFYLGQNSLNHFDTNNFRQTFFPFNFNLLQLACFEYFAPPQSVNFINLATWIVSGLGVFRIARLCDCSRNAALVAAWLALISSQILAQATATTNDLALGSGLLCIVVFVRRWIKTSQLRDALIAGTALGLFVGTKLTVVFFVPAAGLIFVLFVYQRIRAGAEHTLKSNLLPWLIAAAPAIALSGSFAMINILNSGHWMTSEHDYALNRPLVLAGAWQTAKVYLLQLFIEPFGRFTYDTQFFSTFNDWTARTFLSDWNPAYAFSPLYVLPPDLNEDHVWFGFAGPFALICATLCVLLFSKRAPAIASCGLLGLGWFAAHFLLYKWSLYNQRYFVPVILIMLPCTAYIWDRWVAGSRLLSKITRFVYGVLALTSLWFAVHYLLHNTRRPLVPILYHSPLGSDAPLIPVALDQRLAVQSKINVISEGGNERIFLLMNQGLRQRFTSHRRLETASYNIISQWAFMRDKIYSNISYPSTYTLVPILNKSTAGVEAFGSIGVDVMAFDYFGLSANANESTAGPGANNILVMMRYNKDSSAERFSDTAIRIVGLNTGDHAQAAVGAEMADGTEIPLRTFTESGEIKVSIKGELKRLTIRIQDSQDGSIIGFGELPVAVRTSTAGPVAPAEVPPLFVADLISGNTKPLTAITGLATREGPYEKFGLPVFKWAKQSAVRIDVPGSPDMKRIRLSLSIRLQVREEGHLGIWFNGVKAREIHLANHEAWADEKVVVTTNPGANIFELRDEAGGTQPDWLAYLEQNPDVKNWLLANNLPLESGAKEHYETKGIDEHRPLPVRPKSAAPPPDNLYFIYRQLRVEGLPEER